MKRYNEEDSSKHSFEVDLNKSDESDENTNETEEKKKTETPKKYPFHRKNYILKSEIYKEILNSNNINQRQKYSKQNNTIINYFLYNENIPQNKIDTFPCVENQTKSIEDFAINQQNTVYNNNSPFISELSNENQNINNFNFNNNIIKINNFYPTANTMIINGQNISPVCLIKDKFGCIMMKSKVVSDPYYANEILFHQIKNDLKDLCFDNFGNYFIQSYLDVISFDNLNTFLNLITDNFTDICLSFYGTRIIQKIIDKIFFIPILLNKFAFILNNKDFNKICNSQYGNHVVLKFLETLHSSEYTNFIYNNIQNNFLLFTNNKHGVFIVQKCISEGNEIQRKIIYQLLFDNLCAIIENEFGNYLVQFILLNKANIEQTFHEILPIILKIEKNIIRFCFSKYSANVIEKCFEQSEDIIRNHILDFLFNCHGDEIIEIIFNEYGVYIILKAIKAQNSKFNNKLIYIINKSDKAFKYIINSKDNNYKSILKIMHKYIQFDYIYKIIVKKINNIVNSECI